jgi:NAD(P)-dependent dehydrogenase (short-subunit alcohol dehydrogenase family)
MAERTFQGTALVTGAGHRLGRAIAIDLAQFGWRVGIHYHASEQEALDVVADVESSGGQAMAFRADLNHLEDFGTLVAACGEALGPLTCLINNAACFEWDSAATVRAETWQMHSDLNLRAPVFLTQAFAKALPEGVEGNVINLIDQKVRRLNPDYFSYTIAKSALWTATQMLAQALAPRIRVNAIAPGPVLPNRDQTEAAFVREWQSTLLKRPVSVEDVTRAIKFLLMTRSITGQMIALDAGQHLAWDTDSARGS